MCFGYAVLHHLDLIQNYIQEEITRKNKQKEEMYIHHCVDTKKEKDWNTSLNLLNNALAEINSLREHTNNYIKEWEW